MGSFPFSRVSSQPRDWTQVSHIVGRFFTSWATREAQELMEWVAYAFSSGSSWPRNQTRVSCMAGKFLTNWAIREGLPNWCDPYWFPFYWYIGRSVIKIVNAVQRGEKREHKGSLVWGGWGEAGEQGHGYLLCLGLRLTSILSVFIRACDKIVPPNDWQPIKGVSSVSYGLPWLRKGLGSHTVVFKSIIHGIWGETRPKFLSMPVRHSSRCLSFAPSDLLFFFLQSALSQEDD